MTRSQTLFEEARKVLPGGVNSPVRAFARVGGNPVFFRQSQGPYLTDEDGRQYIDYVGSWGPMVVGHAHPEVLRRVHEAIDHGLGYGAPTEIETIMANEVCKLVPSVEMVRMVSSGTEATMSAIRLARGFTRRDKIVKFEGCYHGHSDSLLVKAGSGALTFGEPDSLGVPASLAQHTITLDFNDSEGVENLFATEGDQIAAIIVEPVASNMSCVPPVPGFLETLRKVCDEHGTVLIFDEVMTGFRVALGGAQAYYNVRPDLTTLGKIIGGGMPVGAFGGRADIMQLLAPLGGVYQAGTLSGNPIAMNAGYATLQLIQAPGFYEDLTEKSEKLMAGFRDAASANGYALATNVVGGMFGFFFTSAEPVTSFSQVMNADSAIFNRFFNGMLAKGINLAPSPFESGFVSAAHSMEDIDQTIETAATVLAAL